MGGEGVELDAYDQCGRNPETKGEHPEGDGSCETLIRLSDPKRRAPERGMKARELLMGRLAVTRPSALPFMGDLLNGYMGRIASRIISG